MKLTNVPKFAVVTAAVVLLTGCMEAETKVVVNDDGSGQYGLSIALNREKFEAMESMFGDFDTSDEGTPTTQPAPMSCEEMLADTEGSPLDNPAFADSVTITEEDGWCVMAGTVAFANEAELQTLLADPASPVEGSENSAAAQNASSFARDMRALAAFDMGGDNVGAWWSYANQSAQYGDVPADMSVSLLTPNAAPVTIIESGMAIIPEGALPAVDPADITSGAFLVTDATTAVCLTFASTTVDPSVEHDVVVADAAGSPEAVACDAVAAAAGFVAEATESTESPSGASDDSGEPAPQLRSLPDGGWEFQVTGFEAEAGSDGAAEAEELAMMETMYGSMLEGFLITYNVTLPGIPADNNAHTVDGNRFVWEYSFSDMTSPDMEDPYARTTPGISPAQTGSTDDQTVPTAAPGEDSGGSSWMPFAIIAIIVAVVAGLAVLLIKRRSDGGQPPQPNAPSQQGWAPQPYAPSQAPWIQQPVQPATPQHPGYTQPAPQPPTAPTPPAPPTGNWGPPPR